MKNSEEETSLFNQVVERFIEYVVENIGYEYEQRLVECLLIYNSRKGNVPTLRVNEKIYISWNGVHHHYEISVYANKSIDSNSYHLGFRTDFQTFNFVESSGALIISDRSDKMGDYSVNIIPIAKGGSR